MSQLLYPPKNKGAKKLDNLNSDDLADDKIKEDAKEEDDGDAENDKEQKMIITEAADATKESAEDGATKLEEETKG